MHSLGSTNDTVNLQLNLTEIALCVFNLDASFVRLNDRGDIEWPGLYSFQACHRPEYGNVGT